MRRDSISFKFLEAFPFFDDDERILAKLGLKAAYMGTSTSETIR